jgi:hypothetical protein
MEGGNEPIEQLVRQPQQNEATFEKQKMQNDSSRTTTSASSLSSDTDEQTIKRGVVDEKISCSPSNPYAVRTSPSPPSRKRPLPQSAGRGSVAATATAKRVGAQEDSSQGRIVTSGTPSITTGSDDRDSSAGSGTGSNSVNEEKSGEPESSGHDSRSSNGRGNSARAAPARHTNVDERTRHEEQQQQFRRHHHHNQHHSHHSPIYRHESSGSGSNMDDGSSLQVPGDDGSDRLAAKSSRGIVQPATVVASRYNAANSSSSSGGSGGEGQGQPLIAPSLLPPRREPGYHTIRKALNWFPGSRKRSEPKLRVRSASQNSASTTTDSAYFTDEVQASKKKRKTRGNSESIEGKSRYSVIKKKRRRAASSSFDSSKQECKGEGSSSGSGTEGTDGGYAGSASSNEMGRLKSSCSSPSVSSSEESQMLAFQRSRRLKAQAGEGVSSSSDIADFGSSGSETADDDVAAEREDFDFDRPSPLLSSSDDDAPGELEQSYLSAKREADEEHQRLLKSVTRKRKASKVEEGPNVCSQPIMKPLPSHRSKRLTVRNLNGRPPVLTVGSDIIAHVLTFLHPPEILEVLTTPLCKTWQRNFTQSPELWRVLCLVEPFKANMEEEFSSEDGSSYDDSSSDSGDSFCSIEKEDKQRKSSLDKYRTLYTAFVRCMKYLSQIQEDAISGRPPAYIDYGYRGGKSSAAAACRNDTSSIPPTLHACKNKNLQNFLTEARGVVTRSRESSDDDEERPHGNPGVPILTSAARVLSISKKARDMRQIKIPVFSYCVPNNRR